MRKLLIALILAALTGAPAHAAELLGVEHEKLMPLQGTIVDVLCTLGGSCPAQCGGGKRLLGVVAADGKLRPLIKGVGDFGGTTRDLVGMCGKPVFLDGVLIENPQMSIYQVQAWREREDQPWIRSTRFEDEWKAKNGDKEWWRDDGGVKAIIEADGPLGIKGLMPKPKQ
ncbi:MAG: hypothetical protein ACRCTD_04690 [Beijerinckiaceae bacterium]